MSTWFVCLFTFRYLRLVVNLFSWAFLHKLTPIPARPSLLPSSDCTVVIPTLDQASVDPARMLANLRSILANRPAAIILVTVGRGNLARLQALVRPLTTAAGTGTATRITCLAVRRANKREQIVRAAAHATTRITVLTDDSVVYPTPDFLRHALAPFEDARVGCVGTHKRVVREHPLSLSLAAASPSALWRSFVNFLGCVYLERHNFEISATNALDGGVFVVSGRTMLLRTAILHDAAFVAEFTRECLHLPLPPCIVSPATRDRWCTVGPLNADDDNFITRWLFVRTPWLVRIQSAVHIETRLGAGPDPNRFFRQIVRWVRTTLRSNPRMIAHAVCGSRAVGAGSSSSSRCRRQLWTLYAVHVSSLVNFALLIDALLLLACPAGCRRRLLLLAILASKTVKLAPHFRRHPADVLFFPAYVAFAYYHSLVKLYALLTFWRLDWCGRDLAAIGADDADDEA